MPQQVFQLNSVSGSDAQTGLDEVLALVGEAGAELDLSGADLLVLFEGDVSADHVIEEDSKRPDGSGVAMVTAAPNPFWWGIDASAWKKK